MKQALESRGGLRGCRAAVVEIETANEVGKENKIPGISFLNNFSFEKNGILTWRAYNIGPGRYLRYDDLTIQQQGPTGVKVCQAFGVKEKGRGTIDESTRPKTDIFSCNENGCVLTFKTNVDVQAHMDTGQHVRVLEIIWNTLWCREKEMGREGHRDQSTIEAPLFSWRTALFLKYGEARTSTTRRLGT